MNRLNEIEARANAATEGPWEADWRFTGWDISGNDYDDDGLPALIASDADGEDADFIAHARTDVPDMAAALRAVLELHDCIEPSLEQERDHGMRDWCGECDTYWPCATAAAIRQHIGDDK